MATSSVAAPSLPQATLQLGEYIATFEAATEGQLDKLCDFVADTVVDACLRQDPLAKVSVQCCIKSRMVMLFGEIAIKGTLDYDTIIRGILKNVGYDSEERTGLDYRNINVIIAVSEASPDLASALSAASTSAGMASTTPITGHGEYGSGTGYATDESLSLDLSGSALQLQGDGAWTKYCTAEKVRSGFMPVGHTLAVALARRLSVCRLNQIVPWLNPNGKVQVSLKYEKGSDGSLKPLSIHRLCVHATGHDQGVSLKQMQEDLRRAVYNVLSYGRTSEFDSSQFVADAESRIISRLWMWCSGQVPVSPQKRQRAVGPRIRVEKI